MPNEKHYYVIYLKNFINSVLNKTEIGQLFCVIEDEDIAKDFCQKHHEFGYYEDVVELHCRG